MRRKMTVWIGAAVLAAVLLVTGILITAGGHLDVVNSHAIRTYEALLEAAPALAGQDAETGTWTLAAPDGSARLTLGALPAQATLSWAAQPFLDAGLIVDQLPDGYVLNGGEMQYGTASLQGTDAMAASPVAAMQAYLTAQPEALGYHAAMDHFGVAVGIAGKVEWAKALAQHSMTGAKQDKDLVFALSPEPLIAAGVDPMAVQGWVYAQVEVMEMGTTRLVYQFLKPFDIV